MSCSHIAGNKVGHCIHSAMGSDIYAKCRDLISQKTRSMEWDGGRWGRKVFLKKGDSILQSSTRLLVYLGGSMMWLESLMDLGLDLGCSRCYYIVFSPFFLNHFWWLHTAIPWDFLPKGFLFRRHTGKSENARSSSQTLVSSLVWWNSCVAFCTTVSQRFPIKMPANHPQREHCPRW